MKPTIDRIYPQQLLTELAQSVHGEGWHVLRERGPRGTTWALWDRDRRVRLLDPSFHRSYVLLLLNGSDTACPGLTRQPGNTIAIEDVQPGRDGMPQLD